MYIFKFNSIVMIFINYAMYNHSIITFLLCTECIQVISICLASNRNSNIYVEREGVLYLTSTNFSIKIKV